MQALRASSSDIELLQPLRHAPAADAGAAPPPPPRRRESSPALALEPDSDGSETDLEDADYRLYVRSPVPQSAGVAGSSAAGAAAASSSSSSSRPGPAPAAPAASSASSSSMPLAGTSAPHRRRSSSSSVVFVEDGPVAGPSRPRAAPPLPQRRRARSSDDDNDDEIRIEGETGPRHRRTGLALAGLAAELRQGQHRSPPPMRRRSSTPPAPQEIPGGGGIRFGGAIRRENGVNFHARPSAQAAAPPPRAAPLPPAGRAGWGGGMAGQLADIIARGVGLGAGAARGGFNVVVNGNVLHLGAGGGGEHLYQGPPNGIGHDWRDQPAHLPPFMAPMTAKTLEDEWRKAGGFDPPPPARTTRGFTRNFEREFGGYLSDSDDDDDLGVLAATGLFDDAPVAGPSKAGPSSYAPVVLDLIDDSDDDDDEIAIVEPDGQTSVYSGSGAITFGGSTPLPSPAPAPVVPRKRKAPSIEEAPPNLRLVCSGCDRPLILQAAAPSRKMHVLACGHVIDGYCLDFLSRPPPARSGSSSTAAAASAAAAAPATRSKGKGRAPPAPKKKAFKWHCPVESCGLEHTSEGLPVEDDDGGEPVYVWKAKQGKGGVVPVYA